MSYYSTESSIFILRVLFLNSLIQSANTFGIPFPIVLKAAKQFGQAIGGTAVCEITSNGASWAVLTQVFKDSRNLHLWVLSFTNPQDLIIRLAQYAALETVGLSFGNLGQGAGAIAMGGFRYF